VTALATVIIFIAGVYVYVFIEDAYKEWRNRWH
jgi:hypothetical protein